MGSKFSIDGTITLHNGEPVGFSIGLDGFFTRADTGSAEGNTYADEILDSIVDRLKDDGVLSDPAEDDDDEDDEDLCECGESLDDGEGWDGYCGDCADVRERERIAELVQQFRGWLDTKWESDFGAQLSAGIYLRIKDEDKESVLEDWLNTQDNNRLTTGDDYDQMRDYIAEHKFTPVEEGK
jgi:hypothetical protein